MKTKWGNNEISVSAGSDLADSVHRADPFQVKDFALSFMKFLSACSYFLLRYS